MRIKQIIVLGLAQLLFLTGISAPVRAAEPDPEGAAQFQQSYERETAGKLQESLSALDSLPQARKDSYLAHVRRGWLLYRLGRHAESVDAYQRAIAAAPKSIEARVGILLPQQSLRRWGDMDAAAKGALAIDPNNYLASLRLAWAQYNLGHYTESAAVYGKLKELYPSEAEPRSGLGWSLLKQGKNADAARELRELLGTQPRNVLARQGLDLLGAAPAPTHH